MRKNLREALKEHKMYVKKIKKELKMHRFPLSAAPEDSNDIRRKSKVQTVFPTLLKAVQIRANPEEIGPLASIPVDTSALKHGIISSTGEELEIQNDESREPTSPAEAETIGAPVKQVQGSAPAESRGEVQIQKGDLEKLAKVSELPGA